MANENKIQIYKYIKFFKIDTLSLINYHSLYNTELKPKDKWSAFEKRYPSSIGLIKVSRPGISSDGNWVIIHYERYYYFTEGVGYYLLLKFNGRKWEVVESIESWVT